MEAALMSYSSGDYKHRIGNPRWNSGNNRSLISHPSDNLLLASFLAGGGQFNGWRINSYPPVVPSFWPPPQNFQYHGQQQPPLLPLPISMTPNNRNMNIRLSSTRINKNVKNRGRDQSLTPKKTKSQKKEIKKEEAEADLLPQSPAEIKKSLPVTKTSINEMKKEEADLLPPATAEIKESPPQRTETPINEMIGPDPKDLPKDIISRVFSVDKFSGSVVFTPSPPPSSLPLPTFSLRPKVSCHVEAAVGVDAGATDSLRRLLRLR